MKKIILGVSFLMMAAFAGNINAQSTNAKCSSKEACAKEQCDKKDCKKEKCDNKDCENKECEKKGPFCKMPPRNGRTERMMCPDNNACCFENLNLSEDQKIKIQDLDKALAESRKEVREAAKNSETKPSRADLKNNEVKLRTKYLSDLKNILSAEQYTEFLQNYYVNQTPSNPGFKHAQTRMDISRERVQPIRMDKVKEVDVK